ncbi:glycosyltransferase [Oceanobacillus senegalensis]|uniref:glycosyltransferase n=1 Tax=Oceanobacillus senegalensis TaxID=1936063 RepID=UPI000A305F6D|nr:glycosyltransferase [Oceanobacillus senegalensis]
MKKIKLLFIISNINIGGPQKSLLALLDKLDYNLFDVSIYVLKPGGRLKKYYNKKVKFLETDELVTAATLPSENTISYLKTFIKKRKFKMFIGALRALLNHILLRKNMNQERQKFWEKNADAIPRLNDYYDLAFGILGLSTYFMLDAVEANQKFHWIRSDTRILNRDTKIDASYYKKLDGALSVSKECAEIFIEMYPFMKERIEVFYNYIPESFYKRLDYDETLMKTEDNYIKLVTVTRLDPLKGIEMAIESCKYLVDRGFKIKWFILGDGKFRAEIEKMIVEKGIKDSFILLGFQLNTLSFIKDADIFVHPSRTEGKSNAVDEAKFVGKPIVVTNYDTVAEQIEHGVTGLICSMSGEEIANSIEKIINNNDLRENLMKNCKYHRDGTTDASKFLVDLRRT